jgi:hypothetical protein
MTSYLPSAQMTRGDGYLDRARNLRDQWKAVIPRRDLTKLQNRITMLVFYFIFMNNLIDIHIFRMSSTADMRAVLDSKNGLSKISQARMYCKYARETFHIAKVLNFISKLYSGSFNRTFS